LSNTLTIEKQHTSGVYSKRQLSIVRGKGALLWDDQGREYIDCVSAHGVANLGHAHPAIADAVTAQAHELISCPEMFFNDRRAELLSRLIELAPQGMERVFLCNSGTEAVEAALKFSRFSTKRIEVVATMRGFHGRTMGALSATWNKKYRKHFEPLVPGFKHIPYNNLDKMAAVVTENTAAVLLEIVQGEGGVYPGTPDYLQGVQEICHQRGALLIVDEVQTGFGRTGKMFAFQHHQLQPDILCLAKSIAGGLPMGATILGERVRELPTGIHGSTFGGNPLVCAAANAALQVLEEERLPERAAELGSYFISQLHGIQSPLIREVRGLGLMVGVEIRKKASPYLDALMQRGVLAFPAGLSVIRMLPPLVITRAQLERVVATLEEVLTP
jgi:acetylornithine/LysW-gamma-L-lysine aminotransferase